MHASDHRRLRHVPTILAGISALQSERLDEVTETVMRVGRLLPFDAATFSAAVQYRDRYGFSSTQDAVIYASVVTNLRTLPADMPSCFVTRNPADFDRNPLVRDELRSLGCELKTKFAAAAAFVTSRLDPSP